MKEIVFSSPIGRIEVQEEGGKIKRIIIGSKKKSKSENNGLLLRAKKEILEYLDGKRREFSLPISLEGLSRFQRDVLEAVMEVSYGNCISYKEIAKRIGSEKATKAVGHALRRNPLPLLIPCHRVIKSNGELGGFLGGGLRKKRLLLKLEAENSPK